MLHYIYIFFGLKKIRMTCYLGTQPIKVYFLLKQSHTYFCYTCEDDMYNICVNCETTNLKDCRIKLGLIYIYIYTH